MAQLQQDYGRAALRIEDRVMLDYVAQLTAAPSDITEGDVEALREVGFSDRAILDIAQTTAYFAFVNRLAEGLGVTIEHD